MNLQRCENGHFYDGDTYSSCPHCIGTDSETKKKTVKPDNATVSFPTKPDFVSEPEKKDPISKIGSLFKREKEKEHLTISPKSDETHSQTSKSVEKPDNISESDVSVETHPMEPKKEKETVISEEPSVSATSDLQASLAAAKVDQDDIKTVSIFGNSNGVEPVVGWLVAIEGPDKGLSYNLKAGKNYIGRAATMDVVIINDKKVSREKHCCMLFDPMTNDTYILANSSEGMIHMNGSALLDNVKLKERDCFVIGDTKFMFVPFCGEYFSWEEEEMEE